LISLDAEAFLLPFNRFDPNYKTLSIVIGIWLQPRLTLKPKTALRMEFGWFPQKRLTLLKNNLILTPSMALNRENVALGYSRPAFSCGGMHP
jgi:hypothetical protein